MSRSKDPFEEFEFKPLTEGLGFHDKTMSLKKEVSRSGLLDAKIEPEIPGFDDLIDETPSARDLPLKSSAELSGFPENPIESDYVKSFTESRPEISRPLLREERRENIKEKVDTKLDLDFAEAPAIQPSLDSSFIVEEEIVEENFKKVPTAIFASIFDGIVGFTFSIVFMVAMMSVIQVDLLGLLLNAETQLLTQLSFVALYFAILQLYIVVSRLVAMRTIGEWAFDVFLSGRDGERTATFPLRVISRSMLMMATGFVVLPILSFIIRRDIASFLTGTQLYQIK